MGLMVISYRRRKWVAYWHRGAAGLLLYMAGCQANAVTDTRSLAAISSSANAIVTGTVSSAVKEGDHVSLKVSDERGACGTRQKIRSAAAAMASDTGAVSGSRYIFFLGPETPDGAETVMAKFRLVEGIRDGADPAVVIDIDNHQLVPRSLPIHQLLQKREVNDLNGAPSVDVSPPIVVASYALLSDFCAAFVRKTRE